MGLATIPFLSPYPDAVLIIRDQPAWGKADQREKSDRDRDRESSILSALSLMPCIHQCCCLSAFLVAEAEETQEETYMDKAKRKQFIKQMMNYITGASLSGMIFI